MKINSEKNIEVIKLKNRFIISTIFLLILMYFSMGITMWNFPVIEIFENNPLSIRLLEMFLTIVILILNGNFFINGVKSLVRLKPNMDTLIAIGAGASFFCSYFESAAMIVTLITFGRLLEEVLKGKITKELKFYMDLAPKIVQMVEGAAASKSPIAKVADQISAVFVPAVMLIAVLTVIIWYVVGYGIGFALSRGISVLVISCPCALGLATPVAIMVGNGVGAKHGILFKNATALELAGKVNQIVLDKTGTITVGQPKVTDIICTPEFSKETLIKIAYSLENRSEHPLAKAIMDYGEEHKVPLEEVEAFTADVSQGITATYQNTKVCAGNLSYVLKNATVPSEYVKQAEQLAKEGKTPLFFTQSEKLVGIIAVADVLKEDSISAIEDMKKLELSPVMLTGDNPKTAAAIAELAGIEQYRAGLLADGKEKAVRELREKSCVAMVGDGINDAPTLMRADIGIAIGAGTDVAIEAADIVLMHNQLSDVPKAVRLSRKVLSNIHQNLFWAFFYNCIGIPLAAGVFYLPFEWKLNPMFAAAAMSLSSSCVVANALRLNRVKFKPYGK